jgi:hypothetical protein
MTKGSGGHLRSFLSGYQGSGGGTPRRRTRSSAACRSRHTAWGPALEGGDPGRSHTACPLYTSNAPTAVAAPPGAGPA